MMWVLYLLAALSEGIAQPEFELIEGDSILSDCATTGDCGGWSMSGLAELMTTQAFTLQQLPAGNATIRSTSSGPMFEWGFDLLLRDRPEGDTPSPFPFAPRLALGLIHEEKINEGRYSRIGVGTYLIPPITLRDTSLFSSGINVSFTQQVGHGPVGVGGGVAYSWTRVAGPFFGGPEGLEAAGALPPDFNADTYSPTCAGEACDDVLILHSLAPSLGISLEPHPVIGTHVQVGVAWFQHELTIGFEQSHWQQLGGHPQWQAGISVRPAPVFQLSLAHGSLFRSGAVPDGESRLVNKIQVAISHHWAARRPPESTEEPAEGVGE
jgi:hypothetical protein